MSKDLLILGKNGVTNPFASPSLRYWIQSTINIIILRGNIDNGLEILIHFNKTRQNQKEQNLKMCQIEAIKNTFFILTNISTQKKLLSSSKDNE